MKRGSTVALCAVFPFQSRCVPSLHIGESRGDVWLKAKFVQLHHVEHNSPVTEESDPLFWRTLYTGLLLALQEQGILDHTQCQDALEYMAKHRAGKEGTR